MDATVTPEMVNRAQDRANRALLDNDWETLEELVAPGCSLRLVAVQYTNAPEPPPAVRTLTDPRL